MKAEIIKEHQVAEITKKTRLIDYLDGIFEELPTRSSLKKAFKKERILLNNVVATSGVFLKKSDIISLLYSDHDQVKPYPLLIEVCYEDEHLMIVNKPAGLITSGNVYRNLENALAYTVQLPEEAGYLKHPKPVHRLDSMTSGLIICAKTIRARFLLGQMFEKSEIQKTYHALVMGNTPEYGAIDLPVDNKPSKSHFRKIKSIRSLQNDYLTLLELNPETGRTHQLRIHCAASGFPIYGDQLYANQTIKSKGLFLACSGLSFVHPITETAVKVECPLPTKFENRMKNEQTRWEKYDLEISFSRLKSTDFDELLNFAKENFRLTYEHLNNPEDFKLYVQNAFEEHHFRAETSHPESYFILLKKQQQLLGYYKLNVGNAQTEQKPSQYAELERVYISADHKGQGLGRKMIAHGSNLAKSLGKTKIWLGVWEHNTAAQKFYSKMGFETTGKHVFQMGKDPQTDYILERNL